MWLAGENKISGNEHGKIGRGQSCMIIKLQSTGKVTFYIGSPQLYIYTYVCIYNYPKYG